MAHYYFKVPPHLAQVMGIANIEEKRLKDGNYLAYYEHMRMFYPPYKAAEKAEEMGCLALQPWEMLQEVRGEVSRPLPQPTDPRFFPPKKVVAELEEIVSEESVSLQETIEEEEGEEQTTAVVDIVIETDSEEEDDNEQEEEGGE